ncbi:MAG: helix-turn-helix transcriptional regulator [Oscillospiraceae bacterium]
MYEIFAALLAEKNVTAYQVFKATGVAQSSLSDWKSGKSKPKYEKMLLIAEYFGVSVDYLLTGEDATKKAVVSKDDSFSEENMKVALFGGDKEVTDEMWDEVKRFAAYVKDRESKK